jgi:MFS family permease
MSRLLVLTRHFFNRLFQNEVFPFEDQMKERLYMAGALLTVLGGHVSNTLLMKYMFWEDAGTSWQEKTFFLAFFMAVLAILVVLDWDILFPDPKDYANLMVLPVRLRTVFGAKFLSFLVFIGLYTVAVNAFAVFVVAFFLPKWKSDGDVGFLFLYVAAHLLAAGAAFLFVFFLFVLVHAILLLLLPPRAFKRISLLFRFALLAVLVFGLMAFIVQSPVLGRVSDEIVAAKAAGGARAAALPPLWFVGLYETILGTRDPVFRSLARTACAATAGLAVLYFAAMGLTYRRHVRRTPEADGTGDRMWRVRDLWFRRLESIASRDRTQQAVLRFVAEGLRTSSRHRVTIAGFVALGLGLDMILLATPSSRSLADGLASRDLLAAPLVVAFFLVVALRLAFSTPIAAEANWIFRLTENGRPAPYHAGTRKAVAAFALVPLSLGTAAVSLLIWPPGDALLHAAYVLAASLVLMEIVFDKFAKVPFACQSVPGKSKLQYFWAFYVLGFVAFTAGFGSLEQRLFLSGSGFPVFFAAAGLLLALIWSNGMRQGFDRLPLVYEEKPEAVMVTL